MQTPETAHTMNPTRKSAWHKLWRDKVARTAFIVLVCLYGAAAFADFLTPYSMEFSDADLGNSPPTIIHWRDQNHQPCAPYVLPVERFSDLNSFRQTYQEKPGKKYPIRFLIKGEPYQLFGLLPSDLHLFGVEEPARLFLIGSGIQRRDDFSRLFFG